MISFKSYPFIAPISSENNWYSEDLMEAILTIGKKAYLETRSHVCHAMESHLLNIPFVLFRTQFNKKNPFTLQVDKNSINESERQYAGKKCRCIVSKILFMTNEAMNFPDETDRYVHVQFENAQTPVKFIYEELTEKIECSFNLNQFQTTENGNYKSIVFYHLKLLTSGVMRRFHSN